MIAYYSIFLYLYADLLSCCIFGVYQSNYISLSYIYKNKFKLKFINNIKYILNSKNNFIEIYYFIINSNCIYKLNNIFFSIH